VSDSADSGPVESVASAEAAGSEEEEAGAPESSTTGAVEDVVRAEASTGGEPQAVSARRAAATAPHADRTGKTRCGVTFSSLGVCRCVTGVLSGSERSPCLTLHSP